MEDASSATAYGSNTSFIDGSSTANEYTYDANGNLTKDLNKGITNITYNVLSLPSMVTFGDGSTISYTYSADGNKLRTVHSIGGATTQTDYCANIIYENNTLKQLQTEDGYVDLSNGNSYYYYLKDHQGNNRVVINSSGTVQETNHYYPFGGIFSSSASIQPYKYNSKEYDTRKNLNLYDYGARHYDPAICRWTTQDPMSEKYYRISPYTYCAGDPVRLVDLEGKRIVDKNGKTIYSHKTGWVEDAPENVKMIAEVMRRTKVGDNQFRKMVDAPYNIQISISDEIFESKENRLGLCLIIPDNKELIPMNSKELIDNISKIEINIYIKQINNALQNDNNYHNKVRNIVQAMASVLAHESVHATDSNNIYEAYLNNKYDDDYDVERLPKSIENAVVYSFLRPIDSSHLIGISIDPVTTNSNIFIIRNRNK